MKPPMAPSSGPEVVAVMAERVLQSGTACVRRILLHTGLFVLAAVGVTSIYLSGLLRLEPGEWRIFAETVAVALALIFPAMIGAHRGIFRRIASSLDRRAAGTATHEDLRQGFAAVADFPRYWFAWGLGWWALGGVLVAAGMWLRAPGFGAFEAGVVVTATVSAAFVTDMYYYLWIKRVLEPARLALAADLPDPAERRALAPRVSLRTKLLAAMTSLIFVSAVYAGLLAHERTRRADEAREAAGRAALLEAVAHSELDLASARRAAARLSLADALLLLDPSLAHVQDGPTGALEPEVLARLRAAAGERGELAAADGTRLAWRRLGADGALVAVSGRAPAALAAGGIDPFAWLVGFATLVAFGAAVLLARDVGDAALALRRQAERIAAGDLGAPAPVETEDDLGDLAHAFERMRAALGAAVGGVVRAANRVQAESGEISAAAASLARVSADQVAALEQVVASVGAIDQQVAGIAGSAESLSRSVEEVSGAAGELDTTGGQLHESAHALAGSVDQVASSIEQMARSIGQVARSADQLSLAADEASTSTDESARAVAEVDRNAAALAELSSQVVALAERGRERVGETLGGMQAIQEATGSALEVIRGLGERALAIGSVVGVIDDVADETSLLALNAAIISAQAGEHGRAFSVVADEIKALAERVSSSTKEIGALIRAVQEQSARASGAVASGAETVTRGVALAGEAGLALEEITRAARESGARTQDIVGSLREQAGSTEHVAGVVGQVRSGSAQIRGAILEQGRSTAALRQNARGVAGVSERVRATSEEQVQAAGHIRRSVEEVREAVVRIDAALRGQSAACRQAFELVARVSEGTQSNQGSVRRLEEAIADLRGLADALRDEVQRFRV
jgi:methyl-accepting chemotaxis protein